MEIFAFCTDTPHTHTRQAIHDFINFTYFIIAVSCESYLWSRCQPAVPGIHDSQSLYAILTFSVFTFPNGFLISFWKKTEMGFLQNN